MSSETPIFQAGQPLAVAIGCGGMGLSVARALGRRHPLLLVDIDQGRLDAAVGALEYDGYAVRGQRCDIIDPVAIAALGEGLAQGPGVRALAHVAAVGKTIGSWRKLMHIDLDGAINVASAVEPYLVPGAAAVFVSSLASYLPPVDAGVDAMLDDPLDPGFLDKLQAYHGGEPDFDWAYNYAKLGVNRLAERLARKWGPMGARALSISPGLIDSPMARIEGDTLPSHDGTETRVTRGDKAKEVPLGRQGSLVEVTNVIDFLLSDAASYINGIDVVVDGGHRAVWRANGTIGR